MKTHLVRITIAVAAAVFVGCTAPAAMTGARDPDPGARITGPVAQNDVPAKPSDGVTEKYWKLVELNGRPVPALEQEPHFILSIKDRRVTGFTGCNSFIGSYELNEAASRIRFVRMVSTLKVCASGEEVELAFHQALRAADNYSLTGNRLALNRARMAPLARFEAVNLR